MALTTAGKNYFSEDVLPPCDPPIERCSCEKGSMNCYKKSFDKFPLTNSTAGITVYTFTECQFVDITDIPYESATSLLIENCPLSIKISENAFNRLTQLKILSLEGNTLVNISKSLFANVTGLTSLNLKNNHISELPGGIFDVLPKLEQLILSDNKLNSIENLFVTPSTSITEFICEGCGLTAIPAASLSKLPNLKDLNLNRNKLVALSSDSFVPVAGSLQTLSLDNCSIQDIDVNAFRNMSSITSLNLGNNKISQLPQGVFTPLGSLTKLYLEGNQFTTMFEDRAPWKNLTELKLGNNPWNCDCLIDWMHTYQLGKTDKENVTCLTPPEFKGKNLFSVESGVFCNGPSHGKSALVLGIAIPVILVCLGMIGYYIHQIVRNRRRQAHQRHSFKYRSVYGDTVESNSKQSILS